MPVRVGKISLLGTSSELVTDRILKIGVLTFKGEIKDESHRVIGGFVKICDWILKIQDEMISDTQLETLIKMVDVHFQSLVCY
ncbi:hypothetical protein HanIR_Chr04g0199631 [Helianthus annuus]|nr:hypothetical protein HanIR_Chr04g0199631 [Helianthus annuus]